MGLFGKKKKNNTASTELENMLSEMSVKERLNYLLVKEPDIVLQPGELCLFRADATVGKQRKKTIGYSSTGLRTSLKIVKGISLYTRDANVNRNRITYWEQYPCRFYMTSTRYIALAQVNGFEIKANKVLNMQLFANGLIIYAGNRTKTIFMNAEDTARFKAVSDTLKQAVTDGIDLKTLVD